MIEEVNIYFSIMKNYEQYNNKSAIQIYSLFVERRIISRVILKNNLKISLIFPFQTFLNFFLYKNEYF